MVGFEEILGKNDIILRGNKKRMDKRVQRNLKNEICRGATLEDLLDIKFLQGLNYYLRDLSAWKLTLPIISENYLKSKFRLKESDDEMDSCEPSTSQNQSDDAEISLKLSAELQQYLKRSRDAPVIVEKLAKF